MTDDTPDSAQHDTPAKAGAERIAKAMARAGVASRRDAERMIVEGRVTVNGKTVASPALDVTERDRIALDGKPIDAKQPTRLWLYYKPLGLVVSEKDEKGRQTVFDVMPEGMPRVMSVGRLDLNSEGLLLLTNDGELKRRLELPETGWLRKYRVRVNGQPNDLTFDPLRRGVTVDGEDFLPMEITLDRQQGANAWLTVGLREGRNREIRRAMTEVKLYVNRLIRVSYGPFRLNEMKPGDIVEVKARVMREQLGSLMPGAEDKPSRPARPAMARGAGGGPRRAAPGREGLGREGSGRERVEGEAPARKPRAPRKPAEAGEARHGGKPRAAAGERRAPGEAPRSSGSKSFGARRAEGDATGADGSKAGGRSWGRKSAAEGAVGRGKPAGRAPGSAPRGPRPGAEDAPRGGHSFGGKPGAKPEGRSFGGKPGAKPEGRSFGGKPGAKPEGRSFGGKPGAKPEGRSFGGKPGAKPEGRSFGGKPAGKPAGKPRPASTRNGPAGGKPRTPR